ncbi:MAG: glycosyltransferase family 4 protein [Planctomycetota bacterium]
MTAENTRETPERPRRILFLTGRLQPNASCRATMALTRQLNRLGCETQLIARSGSVQRVYPEHPEAQDDPHNPPIWISRALDRNLRGYLSVGRLVGRTEEMDPDLIHVQGVGLAHVAARLVRRVRKPYVLSIADFVDPGRSVPRSRRFLRGVTAASEAIRVDLVNRLRLPRELIRVVPEGVDASAYPSRKPGISNARIPVIGTIGRLVASKGQEQFVRMAHLLSVRGRRTHFVVGGEGPDRKRLQNLIADLHLVERVTFAREPVDQLEVLRAMDVLVVPALREALGLPIMEAMVCGIPVVAASAGGVFSLVENNQTGILVAKNDPDALATAVETLLNHREEAARLAARARERVASHFNIAAAARRIIDVYDTAARATSDDTTVTTSTL